MAITVTFTLDEKTMLKLGQISSNGKKSEKIRDLISREWERLFDDGELAHAPVEDGISVSIPAESRP